MMTWTMSTTTTACSYSMLLQSKLIHNRHHHSISSSIRRHLRPSRRRHVIPSPPTTRLSTSTSTPNPDHLNLVISVPNPHRFIRYGTEVLDDLRTLIAIDNNRLVISCRRPTLVFVGTLTLIILIIFKLGQGMLNRKGIRGSENVVYRRDRSLGGRQVLVARTKEVDDVARALPPPRVSSKKNVSSRRLPSWWPLSLPPPVTTGNDKLEYQRMADRLIRAILDQRLIGSDISEHDIVQFRRLCRGYGVKVFIETANARDSFYRASVDFALKVCESVDCHSVSVNIDGEDARQFVAGIAGNLGVENSHAATIVTAAIAARTRSCFLQAWALEMQGKHSEATAELSKICILHRVFPPEENSPEMEMVARGLEKNLKLEQRKFLMGMLAGTCKDGNHRSAAEALGLVSLPEFGISREAS